MVLPDLIALEIGLWDAGVRPLSEVASEMLKLVRVLKATLPSDRVRLVILGPLHAKEGNDGVPSTSAPLVNDGATRAHACLPRCAGCCLQLSAELC